MHLAAYRKLGKSNKFFFMRISEFFQYFINIRLKKITSSEEMRRLLGKNKQIRYICILCCKVNISLKLRYMCILCCKVNISLKMP